jgi:hypothetical protein
VFHPLTTDVSLFSYFRYFSFFLKLPFHFLRVGRLCSIISRANLLQVFLKYFHVELLNQKLSEFVRRITTCQKHLRSYVARRKYDKMIAEAKAFAGLVHSVAVDIQKLNSSSVNIQKETCKFDAEQKKRLEGGNEQKTPSQEKTGQKAGVDLSRSTNGTLREGAGKKRLKIPRDDNAIP